MARERNALLGSDGVGGAELDNVVVCAIFRKVWLAKGSLKMEAHC